MTARVLLAPAVFALCAAGQTLTPDVAPAAMVSGIRAAALAYGDRLRNFTCTQVSTRSIGASPTGPKWKLLETQEWELNYVDHREHYQLLRVNGATINLEKRIKKGYFKGSGQFGSALLNIFLPKANAEFEEDRAEGACVLRYRVAQSTSTIVMQADLDKLQLGHHGMVWADCKTGAVTRFVTETDTGAVRRMGRRVPVAYRLEVQYALTKIGDEEFLLPQTAVDIGLFYKTWTKSEIQFTRYRKYDAKSTINFGEGEVRPVR